MNTITKLALRRLKVRKTRSAVICVSILLMMILFMTVVSVSVNLFSGYSVMSRMASGTDYHGYIRADAFTLSAPELERIVSESDDIGKTAILWNASPYAESAGAVVRSYEFLRAVDTEDALGHFYIDITEGGFPEDDSGILVDPLFFPDAAVGDMITLFYIKDTGYIDSAEFIVTGLINSRTDTKRSAVIRYSGTLADTYGFSPMHMNVYFSFQSDRGLSEKYDHLLNVTLNEYKRPDGDAFGNLNQAYFAAPSGESNLANISLALFSAVTVFACSFLLIYNIYSIALAQDMRSFGLLGIVGATHGQIKRMIITESLILFALTSPVGLFAGYFIGWKLLTPLLFSALAEGGLTFEFSFLIPLLTVALTLFTLLWSAVRPLRKLRRMTPVSAVVYTPASDLPVRFVRKRNRAGKDRTPDVARMAGYRISRNRVRTIITALSVSVSVILFTLVSTLCDYITVLAESDLKLTDYIIKPYYTFSYEGETDNSSTPFFADSGIGIPDEYIQAVENSISVEKSYKIRTAMTTVPTPASAVGELRNISGGYPFFDYYPELGKALSGNLDILVVGIPDELFSEIQTADDKTLGNDRENSCVVSGGANTRAIVNGDGASYGFTYFHDGDNVSIGGTTYSVIDSPVINPINKISGFINTSVYRSVLYMSESEFVRNFGDGQTYALLVDAKKDCYDLLRSDIDRLNGSFGVTFDEAAYERYRAEAMESGVAAIEVISYHAGITGRMDGLDRTRQTVFAIRTVGMSFAAMIFLIGALNTVNTALTSAVDRKRECAVLNAIGMTDRQMMAMILLESIYSGGAAVLISVLAGLPAILILTRAAMNSLVSPDWLRSGVMLLVCVAVSVASGIAAVRMMRSDSAAVGLGEE